MITGQCDEIMDDLDYVKEHKKIDLGKYVKVDAVLKIIEEIETSDVATPLVNNDGECEGFLINSRLIYGKIQDLRGR